MLTCEEKRKCPQGLSHLDPLSKSLSKQRGAELLLQNLKGKALHPRWPSLGAPPARAQAPVWPPALALVVSVNGPWRLIQGSPELSLFVWITLRSHLPLTDLK